VELFHGLKGSELVCVWTLKTKLKA